VIMAHNEFVAREFKTVLKINCMKHTLCPPCHPSTNGLPERREKFQGDVPVLSRQRVTSAQGG